MSESDEWGLDGDGDDDDRRRRGSGLRSRMGRLLQPLLRSLRPGRMKKPGRRTAPDFGPEPAWSRGSEEEYYGRPAGHGLAGKPGYGGPAVVKGAGGRRGAGEGSAEPDEMDEGQQGEPGGGGEGEAAQFEFDEPDWLDDVSAERDAVLHELEKDDWEPLTPYGDGVGVGVAEELSDGEADDIGTILFDSPDWPTEVRALPDDAGATCNPSVPVWADDLMAGELGVGAGMPDLGPDPLGTDVGVALDPQLGDLLGPGGVLEIADPFAADPGEGKPGADPFGEDPFAGWEFDKPGNVW